MIDTRDVVADALMTTLIVESTSDDGDDNSNLMRYTDAFLSTLWLKGFAVLPIPEELLPDIIAAIDQIPSLA